MEISKVNSMTKIEEKLIELGYSKYDNTYEKWVNDWSVIFKLDCYENDWDEDSKYINEYYVAPNMFKCIDRDEINLVLDILEKDLEVLKQCQG